MFTVTSVAVEFSSACIVERTAKANEDIASAEARVAQSLCVIGKWCWPRNGLGRASDSRRFVPGSHKNKQNKVNITLYRSSEEIVNIVICLTETYSFYYVEQITTASNLESLPKFP